MEKQQTPAGKMKIAAVGDIHVHAHDQGKWTDFFSTRTSTHWREKLLRA
ncbi:hypothetical protein [Pontibacter diazotrophicus]|nr:hypothetical protein [Pontibacter diazotrophicus]